MKKDITTFKNKDYIEGEITEKEEKDKDEL